MKFFLTGHTGFKGSWLTALLVELGHKVDGFSDAVEHDSLFASSLIEASCGKHTIGDIRDYDSLLQAVRDSKPDVAIHLAAQPLVLASYREPLLTYQTNVNGTLNFLEATRRANVNNVLIVTSDKVYKDTKVNFHSEDAALGGYDPYSGSKAMADILTQSWCSFDPSRRVHIARAGNVIGAYDRGAGRLLPGIVSAIRQNSVLKVRLPDSVRPWQFVLDCLFGYITFAEAMVSGSEIPKVLNFGPSNRQTITVREILEICQQRHPKFKYRFENVETSMKETHELTLDSTLAKQSLGWESKIDVELACELTLEELENIGSRQLVQRHISSYLSLVGKA